jgi:NADH-quinone oxidoreductase subunit D
MPLEIEDPRVVEFDVRTDEMLVNMGPQHPSTHGVLRLLLRTDGEVVHEAEPHIGYLHRCAEKIGENLTPVQWIPYSDRMDYLAGMNMNLGVALATEKLLGLEVPPRADVLRVIVAELNRIASHLLGMGAYGLDLGSFTPFLYGFREREMILDLFEEACGARLTYSFVTVGGTTHDLPTEIAIPPGLAAVLERPRDTRLSWTAACRLFLDWLAAQIPSYHTLLTTNHLFVQRTAGLGILSADMAIDHACTGPVLRGSGVKFDLRRDGEDCYTRLYREFEFDIPAAPFEGVTGIQPPREMRVGDNWCRFYVRMLEVVESIRILRQALDRYDQTPGPFKTPHKWNARLPAGEAYLETECPRGQMGFYLVTTGQPELFRARAKSSSFCNLSIISKLCAGALIGDIPAILGSLDLVMGEIDR